MPRPKTPAFIRVDKAVEDQLRIVEKINAAEHAGKPTKALWEKFRLADRREKDAQREVDEEERDSGIWDD